jgi:hypothetical protein
MKYYHITHPDNLISILSEGLKSNDLQQIFLFQRGNIKIGNVYNSIQDCIASNQVFLDEYVLLEIDSEGFETPLINDNVAEMTSEFQWILNQENINPQFIHDLGVHQNNYKSVFNFLMRG